MEEKTMATGLLLRALWRRKWWILLSMALCAALIVGMAALCLPAEYETSAVFLLQGAEAVKQVESGIYLLQTRQTLDAVLQTADVGYGREELANMLTAQQLGETPMLQVVVTARSPEAAKAVADAVVAVLPQRLEAMLEEVQVQIADTPELPHAASGPKLWQFGLLGLLVGMLVPVGLVTLREYWEISA